VVIAVVNGELTVKRLRMTQGRITLAAENPAYAPMEIRPDMEFEIWGVVTTVIHAL
jgi:DNA polymerase V